MVEIYFGSDTIKTRAAALKAVDTYRENNFRIERRESGFFDVSQLIEMAESVSLFGESTAYVLDTPSEDEVFFESLLSSLTELVASNNVIIVIENNLLAATKKKLEKAQVKQYEFARDESKSTYDPFAINNALVAKDKKALWVLLEEARLQGIPAEETIGILWWQLKTLRLAAMTKTAEEAGMKDFPYNKAKRSISNFKPGEIEMLSRKLLSVYHDGHGGVKDINLGLEEWVLGV